MATTTVTRKGGGGAVPPRTLSTRQKKLGPAPFASFEDLSDDNDPSPPDSSGQKIQPMPEIKEDTAPSEPGPEEEEPGEVGSLQFGGVTVIPSTAATIASSSSAPTSGPTSGLQTPSTPRIDISCASSSTPPSEESNSERELFQGGLGFAFHEEGTDDLRSSTEELEFGVDDDIHDEKKKQKQETEELLRRASHPANVFHRKASLSPTDDADLLTRKPSAHSLYLEGFLQRPCRHSSFGSADRQRPGAISSLSADGRRSASPHKMLLETSFCGNKPIPTPSMDLDSPPRTDGPSQSSLQNRKNTAARESSGMLSSDSSFENQKPQKLTALTTVQVHHHHIQDNNSSSDPLQQMQPTPSPSGISESRAPPISSPDSPKSSDHWRPITPQELKSLSPRPTSPRPFRKDLSESQSTWTPPAARKNSTKDASPIQLTMTRNSSSSSPSKHQQQQAISSPAPKRKEIVQDTVSSSRSKQQQKLPAASKETDLFKSPLPRRKELPRSDAIDNSPRETPTTARKTTVGKSDSSGSSTKELPKSKATAAASTSKEKGGSGGGGAGGGGGQQSSSGKQFDEITTEMKITEDPFVPVEDVPIEKKGFFRDDEDDDDDDELPYVPTTLPLEKSSVVPIIPIKERRKLATMVTTKPTQRPRCVRPPNPASLNDYIAYSSTASQSKSNNDSSSGSKSDASSASTATTTATTTTKMKINLPRDDSVPESPSDPGSTPKSRDKKKAPPTSWADFAEMGLRSPREIRRRMKMEENGASVNNTDETSAYQSDSSQDTFGPANGGSDDETESLLKLPKIPFANDLDVKSNRSSVISQEEVPASPGSLSSSQLEIQDNEDGS